MSLKVARFIKAFICYKLGDICVDLASSGGGVEIPMGWGTIEIDIAICGNTLQITPGRLAPTPKNQSQKDIRPTLFLRYWLPLAITKNTHFHRLFGEIFPWLCAQNIHFPPKNGNTHAAPMCIWWGGGGGTTSLQKHSTTTTTYSWC